MELLFLLMIYLIQQKRNNMITAKLQFNCVLCGNGQNFYVMPIDEKTKANDYVHSLTKYRLSCKKCGQDYILSFKVKELKRNKKNKK